MKIKKYTHQIACLIPDDLYKTIIDITNRSSIVISDFMRDAIEQKLNDKKDNDNSYSSNPQAWRKNHHEG